MKTKKLYQKNVYLSNFNAVIVDIKDDLIALDQSAFFPEGGGQSSDLGQIETYFVTYVFEKDNIIWHKVSTPFSLEKGQEVSCFVHWHHRFENMQRHCAEHILSASFYKLYGGVNKGFHMGDEYMTADIYFPKHLNISSLTEDMVGKVELLCNETICKNLPVTMKFFTDKEDANRLKARKDVVIEDDISMIIIGDEKNPTDCVACCGTHPSFTGEIGIIKIFKVEKYKSMFRVYFDAGKKALNHYYKVHQLTKTLNNLFSSNNDTLLNTISSFIEKDKTTKSELKELKTQLINIYIDNTSKLMLREEKLNIASFKDIPIDDLLHIGKVLINTFSNLICLYCEDNYNLVLIKHKEFSFDIKSFISDAKNKISFSGGGGGDIARLTFQNTKDLFKFIDFLKDAI